MGGGGALLLKKSKGNQYLKMLDFSKLYVADAPLQKKTKI